MSQGRTGKGSSPSEGTETIARNSCSYQAPSMVGTNVSTKKITSSTTQQCSSFQDEKKTVPKKVGAICACFVGKGDLIKTQVENGLIKIFNLRGQTLDVSG